jgi:hypothetical protein
MHITLYFNEITYTTYTYTPPFKSLHHVTLLCIKITTVFIVTTITILQISTLRMRVHVMCVYIYIIHGSD